MRTLKSVFGFFILTTMSGSLALAAPNVDTITIQGYMKKASGAAVTNGTYNIVFAVCQTDCTSTSNVLWVKKLSTSVTNGLFSKNLTGAGDNLSADAGVPVGTNLKLNKSGYTLNPTNIAAVTSGALVVRAYAYDTIDSNNPTFDISINSVASAFYAGVAGRATVADSADAVAAGSVTSTGLATSAQTLPSNWAVPGASVTGTVANATSAATADALAALALDNTMVSATAGIARSKTASGTANAVLANDGSGVMSEVTAGSNGDFLKLTAGAPTWTTVSIPAVGSTNDWTASQNMTGGISTASGALALTSATSAVNVTGTLSTTGAITAGGNVTGPASAFTVQSASGQNMTVAAQGAGQLTLTPGSGNTVEVGGTNPTVQVASGNIALQSASGGTTTVGNSGTTSTTVIQAGTGGIKIGATGNAFASGILSGSATGLNLAATTAQTVTVTGAAVGDPVFCNFNNGSTAMTTTAYWWITAHVRAANTVTAVAVRVSTPANITAIKCFVLK